MKNFKLIYNYFDDEKYRSSFNNLAISTFDIDFERWYKKQLFFNKYCAYSFIHKNQVVSNVSINKMELIVDGIKKKALQLGTVMTSSEYRNQGLAAALINHIIKKYEKEYDFIYLFANDSVLDFYPKFGFKKAVESAYIMDTAQLSKKTSVINRLNPENADDYKTIIRIASNRIPISEKLSAVNDNWPLIVYCLYEFKNDLYYLKEEDTIVILRREENTLHIYDILSLKPFDLDNIIEKIKDKEDEKIEFHFIPELKRYKVTRTLQERQDDTLFVRGEAALPSEILFPMTSQT